MTRRTWRGLRWLVVGGLVSLSAAIGCRSATGEVPGGETHFLKVCESGASTTQCSEGLTCLCGVCTLPCDDAGACTAYAGAECVDRSGTSVCDVPCSDDGVCSALSSTHTCEQGFCRVGTGGGLACERASVFADRFLIIGDNLFAGSNGVGTELEALAAGAAVLADNQEFRDNSSLEANALAYEGAGIAEQYSAGNADGRVRLVVMTGGGVDAVFASCEPANESCAALAAAAQAAEELLQRMATDGVEDVLYVFYPDSSEPGQKERVDVLRSLVRTACDGAALSCRLLDLRPVFEGHYAEYVVPDGLTAAGARATAQSIWARVDACFARL